MSDAFMGTGAAVDAPGETLKVVTAGSQCGAPIVVLAGASIIGPTRTDGSLVSPPEPRTDTQTHTHTHRPA